MRGNTVESQSPEVNLKSSQKNNPITFEGTTVKVQMNSRKTRGARRY